MVSFNIYIIFKKLKNIYIFSFSPTYKIILIKYMIKYIAEK